MVGIGYMTFPRLCELVGLVNVLLIILFTAFASLFGSWMILKAYDARPADTYPLLVLNVLGSRHYSCITLFLGLQIFFGITLFIYFGLLIRYGIVHRSGKKVLGCLMALRA